jgi:peroxiredoxin Q/BCP
MRANRFLSLFAAATSLATSLSNGQALATEGIAEGTKAPLFELKNQAGAPFRLADRAGKGWTILYFYPKASTPGCTKQACAFRDAIKKIRELNAEVYGISIDSVADQLKFHKEHHLAFDLLADEKGSVTELYGVKMPVVKMAKRWTFLLDDSLVIRWIEKDVDPALDAQRVRDKIVSLQTKK